MTPQKAFGWVVLIAGIALETPTTVHLRNVTFQKPLIEKLFAADFTFLSEMAMVL